VLLKFNGIRITSPAQMIQIISDTPPNTEVKAVISRLGKMIELPVIIEELPPIN
jgi:degS